MSYRVLMIASTSFFGDYGGHIRIFEEIRILQGLGHRVCVVTYPLGRNLAGVDIRRARKLPWRAEYEVGSSRHKLALDLLLAWKILRTALEFRPDVIHAHTHEAAFLGTWVAGLLRVPLILDFQGSMTAEMLDHHFLNPRGPFFAPLRALERWIDRRPAAILTSSRNGAQVLTSEFGVASDRIVPLPDCVDPEQLAPIPRGAPALADLKVYLGIPNGRPVVVYLGLLAEYQGTGVLLQAAEKLVRRGVDVHFLIMGFPGVATYAQQARNLGIMHRVSFPGKIPYEQIATWLSLGDVAVAPKMSQTEGNGKILNYMALGLPVVAFEAPVAREYLDHLGVYAPLGDAAGLADAIAGLLADPARRAALGQALRLRVAANFSWGEAGRQIEAVYAAARERGSVGAREQGSERKVV